MPVSLKICGITRLEDALAAADLGVDWLGFNFFPDSPRYINISEAAVIIERLPPKVESVGILVKPTMCDGCRFMNRKAL
jgi:phosphoribosylanthranilate isomerase